MKTCIYCGISKGVTDDHVPPKNLFPKPRPSLITVPACPVCHSKQTSRDDEYFRLVLSFSDRTDENASAKSSRDASFRSLSREEARKYRDSFMRGVRNVTAVSPGGLILGKRLGYEVDLERLFRVVERTVKGLFYYETGARIADTYDVKVENDDTLMRYEKRELEEYQRTVINPLAQIPPKIISADVFQYRFKVVEKMSVWALTFYKQISFLAITGSKEK